MAEGRGMGFTDPVFNEPFVDVDEWRDTPVRHRYVHGGFRDTDCRFSMYFPNPRQYQGRFFQPMSPVPGSEHGATEGAFAGYIEFAIGNGGYLVESNLGRFRRARRGEDSTITGYRASAAVATYSRRLAAEHYGEHRPYGYVFVGSGGGLSGHRLLRELRRRVGRRGHLHPGTHDGDAQRFVCAGTRLQGAPGQASPDRRRAGARWQRRHVRRIEPRGTRRPGRGDPDGVPSRGPGSTPSGFTFSTRPCGWPVSSTISPRGMRTTSPTFGLSPVTSANIPPNP